MAQLTLPSTDNTFIFRFDTDGACVAVDYGSRVLADTERMANLLARFLLHELPLQQTMTIERHTEANTEQHYRLYPNAEALDICWHSLFDCPDRNWQKWGKAREALEVYAFLNHVPSAHEARILLQWLKYCLQEFAFENTTIAEINQYALVAVINIVNAQGNECGLDAEGQLTAWWQVLAADFDVVATLDSIAAVVCHSKPHRLWMLFWRYEAYNALLGQLLDRCSLEEQHQLRLRYFADRCMPQLSRLWSNRRT